MPKSERTEKEKKEKKEKEDVPIALAPISSPLAGKKLTKKLLKLVKKASKEKGIKRGVKEVVKALRKNTRGLCIIAGDISPIDVITHVPVLCEDNKVPYIYVPSKEALGTASQTKRPTSCIMVTLGADSELKASYTELSTEVQALKPSS